MAISESELRNWLRSEIFHIIPLNIAVIDVDYNVVDANQPFRQHFGAWEHKKCYQVYKGASSPCADCDAMKTFRDGTVKIHEEEGRDAEGNPMLYLVHTVPVKNAHGTITHVIEMSRNVTDIRDQQREYQILFERVPHYVAILDREFRILRANEKLRQTFGECRGRHCYQVYKKSMRPCEDCPAARTFSDGKEHSSTHVGVARDGSEKHYVVTTTPLRKGREESVYVMEILTDITRIRQMENEKLEAERLAAVGQTVAGLAHGVKNILMGVEGGMYMVGSGIKKDDKDRLSEGWDMLQRNIEKVSSLVKDFLSFAKGRRPHAQMVDPNALVDDILMLYAESAKQVGVDLVRGDTVPIDPAPLDAEGIETCLTNLVSNAIDACRMSNKLTSTVTLSAREQNGVLIFEVADDGRGMDYDAKQKVFTSFFTTKGGEGTGLGLLTTRKIVQEHGGKVSVESELGEGSVFRIELPRDRLPQVSSEDRANQENL